MCTYFHDFQIIDQSKTNMLLHPEDVFSTDDNMCAKWPPTVYISYIFDKISKMYTSIKNVGFKFIGARIFVFL